MSGENVPKETTRHEQARAHIISRVLSAEDTATRDIGVEAVLTAIRSGGGKNLRGQITQIRNRFEAELDITGELKAAKLAVAPLKKELSGVMWCGQFRDREHPAADKLQKHSGLQCGDLDDLGPELPRVREQLKTSRYLFALFLSPTGNGLKPVFRVPADASKHAGSFRAIEKHVPELTGVQIDESGKDIGRLCFMSYDPDIYVNENAIELEPLPAPEKPKSAFNSNVDLTGRERITAELLQCALEWCPEKNGYFVTCPGISLHTNGHNAKECIVYLNGPPTIECKHTSCRGVVEGVNHELRSRIGKAEFVQTPRVDLRRGAEPVEPLELPPPPVPYVPPPLALLPSVLQDYVHQAAESLNVDVSFILLPLLSALGSAIGNTRSIFLKRGFVQPPVIWTGIVARSGSRKSPSLDAGCFAVVEHERELARQNKQAMEIYENEMAEWESKNRKERGVKPALPISLTCLMDNLTLEALADAIQENPHGVLVKKDELSHWFASFDQYTKAKGADVSQWLSMHTGVFFGLDRRSDHRRYRVHQPRVALSGGIQPEVLKRILLTEDFFERGLPARFLLAYPPFVKDRWTEAEIPDALRASVLALFQKLWELVPDHDDKGEACPKLLRLDADAKAEYVHYYDQCGDASVEAGEREEAAWSKLSGYAARIALVGQCTRDPDAELVCGETMRAACNLARWSGNETVRIYASLGESQEQRETRKLVEFINSRGGSVTLRDVITNYWPLKNLTEKADAQLNDLVKAGYGKWEPVPTTAKGGKPTRIFRLLKASASAKPVHLRGEPGGYADAEAPNTQKNTPSGESEHAPEKKPPAGSVSVPVMMTKQMESDLLKAGYSQAEIDKMPPGEACEKLGARRACPEAVGGIMEL